MDKLKRRKFLEFLGKTGLIVGTGTIFGSLAACENKNTGKVIDLNNIPFPIQKMAASQTDDVILSDGLHYNILAQWRDKLSEFDQFGFNNDYIAFVPLDETGKEGILWVNHEYISELFISDYDGSSTKTKSQVDQEMYEVGGSLFKVKFVEGKWEMVKNDAFNRRISAQTMIPFLWDEPILGATQAMGTLANCSGGVTPWGTILTCEENYDLFYGETDYTDPENPRHFPNEYLDYGWKKFYDNPPEHYGWVVEVDPKTGTAQKLIALGRCAHECATVHAAKNGKIVVYSGDDSNDECLYKYISDEKGDLKNGKLYVADTQAGQWISMVYEEQPILQENFRDQTEVLIRLREAAKLLGATPLNRPEDIEIDPINGAVYISLTNNKTRGDMMGSILKIEEDDPENKCSLTFKASTFLAGGEETGFACPDNLAFDKMGNLWFTSDISGSAMNKAPYTSFGNNGLFVVPTFGKDMGKAIQVASAPNDAELTGPCFSPDGRTLFLSIQHPGEKTTDLSAPTSTWPKNDSMLPKPAVICIHGPALDQLNQIIDEEEFLI